MAPLPPPPTLHFLLSTRPLQRAQRPDYPTMQLANHLVVPLRLAVDLPVVPHFLPPIYGNQFRHLPVNPLFAATYVHILR